MNKAVIRKSERIYGFLLKFYPKSYRKEFGEEMKYVFSKSLKDAYTENGEQGIFTLWKRIITDTCKSLVRQHIENQRGGGHMRTKSNDIIMQNKVFIWIALGTVLVLMIPLMAMQISSDVDWGLLDFTVIGVLLFGMGSVFVTIARKVRNTTHRVIIAIAILAAMLLIWIHLAVGIVDSWPLAGS